MQSLLRTVFSLENTSYWLLVIWCIGAGLVLYKMPKAQLLVQGKVEHRWYWFTALILVFPYILWTGYRGIFVDTGAYIRHFMESSSELSSIPKMILNDDKDWGFYSLMVLAKAAGINSYQTFFLIIATVQLLCMIYIFFAGTPRICGSAFLFLSPLLTICPGCPR